MAITFLWPLVYFIYMMSMCPSSVFFPNIFFHRVLGFSCMVLVLWSPVLVPLLPILFQNFTTHSSSRIAELTCVVGLYTAVTILIMLWGKRIRGYEHPLKQYGLDLTSSRKVLFVVVGCSSDFSSKAYDNYLYFNSLMHLSKQKLIYQKKKKATTDDYRSHLNDS